MKKALFSSIFVLLLMLPADVLPQTAKGEKGFYDFSYFDKLSIVRLPDGERSVTIEGNKEKGSPATVIDGKKTYKAMKIEVLEKARKIRGDGGIEIEDGENGRALKASQFEYEESTGHLMLTGEPTFIAKDKDGGKITVWTDRIEAFLKEKEARFLGNVRIEYKEIKAFAGEATYYEDEQKLVLSINPKIVEKFDEEDSNTIEGKKITVLLGKEMRISVEGEGRAKIFYRREGSER